MHQLSNPSPKGADVKAHKRFLHAVVNNHDALWVEYLKPRWARLRLYLYGDCN